MAAKFSWDKVTKYEYYMKESNIRKTNPRLSLVRMPEGGINENMYDFIRFAGDGSIPVFKLKIRK